MGKLIFLELAKFPKWWVDFVLIKVRGLLQLLQTLLTLEMLHRRMRLRLPSPSTEAMLMEELVLMPLLLLLPLELRAYAALFLRVRSF